MTKEKLITWFTNDQKMSNMPISYYFLCHEILFMGKFEIMDENTMKLFLKHLLTICNGKYSNENNNNTYNLYRISKNGTFQTNHSVIVCDLIVNCILKIGNYNCNNHQITQIQTPKNEIQNQQQMNDEFHFNQPLYYQSIVNEKNKKKENSINSIQDNWVKIIENSNDNNNSSDQSNTDTMDVESFEFANQEFVPFRTPWNGISLVSLHNYEWKLLQFVPWVGANIKTYERYNLIINLTCQHFFFFFLYLCCVFL